MQVPLSASEWWGGLWNRKKQKSPDRLSYNTFMTEGSLLGKVALVTGGAVRLGRAISLALASQGADIILHYHSSAVQARALADEIQGRGRKCLAVGMDLSQAETPQALFDAIHPTFPAVDILVNSAAVFPPGSLTDTTAQQWDTVFNVNLRAPFLLAQRFAAQTSLGNIINIIDGRISSADPNHIAYAVSKAGLAYLTKTLAVALAPNIRVNGIAPGAILPPVGAPGNALESLKATIPLQRLGSPDDIAHAVLFFLASPYVTGDILPVTGGQFLSF
jgi:pteridine reductase